MKALSQQCQVHLNEFYFSTLFYPKLNPQIGWISSDVSLLHPSISSWRKGSSTCIEKLFLTGTVDGQQWTCLSISNDYTNLSPIDATPKCPQKWFLILSFLVLLHILLSPHHSRHYYKHFCACVHSWLANILYNDFIVLPSSPYPVFNIC